MFFRGQIRYNCGMKEYVQKRNGGYYVAGKRVSLDSLVDEFRRGASAESIRGSFPTLALEEVYGAIAFYLANQEAVDKSILKGELDFEKWSRANYEDNKGVVQANVLDS